MNRVPRVAVVGCGYWGKNLVRNFHTLGSLVLVCDSSESGRKLARKIAPEVDVLSDFDSVLRSDVQGIVISTPAETHVDLAMRALGAGKHVLVEKPLAMTFEEGVEVVLEAERRERIVMVGHVMEYHPAIVRMLDLARSGVLGEIRYVYSNRLSLGKVRREENILWSFAPHDIAIILRLMGTVPKVVATSGGSYLQHDIADVTMTSLLFEGGVRAHIHVSWLHPFKEQRLVVIGSHKMASFDDVAKELVVYDQRVEVDQGDLVLRKAEGERLSFGEDEPLGVECKAFLDSIATGQPPIADGRSALRVLSVLEAAQRSLVADGKPIRLTSRD